MVKYKDYTNELISHSRQLILNIYLDNVGSSLSFLGQKTHEPWSWLDLICERFVNTLKHSIKCARPIHNIHIASKLNFASDNMQIQWTRENKCVWNCHEANVYFKFINKHNRWIVIIIIETIDVLSKFHFYMRNNKKSYYIFAYAIFAKVKDMAIYI